jgi:hypothetical protein
MDKETEWLTQAESCSSQLSMFNSHDQENEQDGFFRDLFDTKEYFSNLNRLRKMSNEPISKCHHCGANSKVYAYKIGSYARVLIWMAFHGKDGEYVHIPTSGAINGGGDYAKLRYWGLIEKSPKNPDPKKRSSGLWRLTTTGRDFALNKTTINSICYYSHPPGEVLGFEPDQVSIVDALGKYFDYSSLMSGYEWEVALL